MREDGHWPHDQDGKWRCCGVTPDELAREREPIDDYQRDVRESDDATSFTEE